MKFTRAIAVPAQLEQFAQTLCAFLVENAPLSTAYRNQLQVLALKAVPKTCLHIIVDGIEAHVKRAQIGIEQALRDVMPPAIAYRSKLSDAAARGSEPSLSCSLVRSTGAAAAAAGELDALGHRRVADPRCA